MSAFLALLPILGAVIPALVSILMDKYKAANSPDQVRQNRHDEDDKIIAGGAAQINDLNIALRDRLLRVQNKSGGAAS